ncbi:probable inactive poly [ADP-ribose] polymerase SRO5 [Tripterygium wilfordii]|uniref:probable inactive poly [ADP-ribose] polymerase SRO5 n=1 Tax=Tripterygium wilfordii TaxID=458696 RepID=UPI0018F835D6|nr:probable inactive poly [ADP-ribose] polymerase SRO5 [Tripterygium wilfordii]
MENNSDSTPLIPIPIEPAAEVMPENSVENSVDLDDNMPENSVENSVDLDNISFDNDDSQTASDTSVLESEHDALISDGESSAAKGESFGSGLTRLLQGDNVHDQIKRTFLHGLRFLEALPEVVSIDRNSFPGPIGQAKLQAFEMFVKATEERRGGDANVTYAWFPATGDEIRRILQDGFGQDNITNGLCGCGVYLSPDESPTESFKRSVADKYGIHHLLRCRVILGNLEIVPPDSRQSHPFSDQFDSGLAVTGPTTRRYVVWSTYMNTHILPEYVVSFRPPPCLKGFMMTPTSPWISFPALLSLLSKCVPARDMLLISMYYRDHRANKMSRSEMIRQIRKITGDELLIAMIKAFRGKQFASGQHAAVGRAKQGQGGM